MLNNFSYIQSELAQDLTLNLGDLGEYAATAFFYFERGSKGSDVEPPYSASVDIVAIVARNLMGRDLDVRQWITPDAMKDIVEYLLEECTDANVQ
jgi:hypothetical protein